MVGYNVSRSESIKSEYICTCCSLVLNDPMQLTECGHHICKSCFERQIGNYIICSKCNVKTARKDVKFDRAVKIDMQTLLIICALCSWSGMLQLYSNHLKEIHPNPMCTYCKQQFLSVDDLNEHQQFNCEKMTVYCIFKDAGCNELIYRADLIQHYQSIGHQKVLMELISQMKSKNQFIREIMINEIKEIDPLIDVFSNGIHVVRDDVDHLQTESIEYERIIESLKRDLSSLRVTVQEQNGVIDGIRINQNSLGQTLEFMKQKINDIGLRSNDGTFVWKITNTKERLVVARSLIYSPEFYSSTIGYKIRLQLELNGDNTNLSIYVSSLPGEFDAIIEFPFNFQIICCLFDQTDQRKHIINSLKANFQRPSANTNMPNGIADFAPLNVIFRENSPYIENDAMYIKVLINFLGLPLSMYAHIFDLNQAMSTSFISQKTNQ